MPCPPGESGYLTSVWGGGGTRQVESQLLCHSFLYWRVKWGGGVQTDRERERELLPLFPSDMFGGSEGS